MHIASANHYVMTPSAPSPTTAIFLFMCEMVIEIKLDKDLTAELQREVKAALQAD